MRKLIVFLTMFIGVYSTAFAQSKVIDSLNQLLFKEKEDTSRVMLMTQISRGYLYSEPDTALAIAREALQLSRKINFPKGEAYCLRAIGTVFVNTGNYPNALESYLQALKIAEDMHDNQIIALLVSSLSDVYFYESDITRSVDYSHRALSIYQNLHDSSSLATTITNLGDTYEKSNQLDSALIYTSLGYRMSLSQNNTALLGTTLNNLGNIFLKLGKTDSARFYYISSVPYSTAMNNNEGLCETYLGIAKIFLQQNNADSALYYARLSFSIAKETGFTDKLLDASNFLAAYYKSVRNVDSAYMYQSATIAAKDSLFGQQKANQIQSMTYDEAMRQQQIEDAKEQAQVQLRQNALIGGVATLLIAAFLLYLNNRQKRKANLQLQKQKEEIDHKAHELAIQKENLQQSYENVEQLGEVGRKITSSLSVEKVIGTVYDNVNALMDASVFGIGIYNDALEKIEFPATYEDGQALPFYANSIYDKNRFGVISFNEGKEIIIGNLDEEYKLHLQEVQAPHEGKQPVSLIFLPLVIKEKKLGVITVQSFQQNAYSDYHLFMLRNIAIYTAIALENAESFETLNQTILRLRSTQAQLVQSEKMASLGELTAGIAHEIQNPLNFVNNFSEVNGELISELVDEVDKGNLDEVKSIAKDIKENEEKINYHGKRADSIVKGMLQHSRANTSKKESTDINALADEYLRLAYHGLRAKDKSFNTEIKTDFDTAIGKLNVVSQDIGRVLLNLYNNAFYAVSKSPHPPDLSGQALKGSNVYEPIVSVSTKKLDGKILISVKDNGPGIPQNIVDKIFQPFFTTKPTGQGTGLGLSLAYDIIKAHGGEIKVETKEGKGSEFVIQLPT